MSLILSGPYTQNTPPVQKGLNTAFCRRQTGRWSPTNGWTFDQEFQGFSYFNMQALANQYGNAGIEYEITLQNGVARMTTRDTTGNVTIDVWEIAASRETVNWLKNPALISLLQQVAYEYVYSINPSAASNSDVIDWNTTRFVKKMQQGIENDTEPFRTTVPTDINAATDPGYVPPTGVQVVSKGLFSSENFFNGVFSFASINSAVYLPIFRAYQRAQAGQDSFFLDKYTLRHKTNASNRGFFNVADVDVNCLYTQSQFYSEITNPIYWIFPCPPEIISALNTIFASLGTTPPHYLKSALKGGASRVTAANNRVDIVTEYELFNWSTDDYQLAT